MEETVHVIVFVQVDVDAVRRNLPHRTEHDVPSFWQFVILHLPQTPLADIFPGRPLINLVDSLDYGSVDIYLPPRLARELPPTASTSHVSRGSGEHGPLLPAIRTLHQ